MDRDVFNDMTEEFFFGQKSYGNTTRFNFFYTRFFFSYRSGHIWQYRSKTFSVRSKIFQYDSLETREFWWVKTPMGIQWFEIQFLAIFSISRESIESRSKIGYKPDRKQLGRFKSFWLVQKSYGHGFFYVSTPFLLVVDTRSSVSWPR